MRRAVAIVTVMGQIKRTLWEKLSAPLLLMAGIVALATLLSWDFLPKMENLSPRENWTGAMRGLSLLSDGIGQHLPLIVVILLMLTGWTVWSLPNMTGLLRKKVLDNLPPWSLYREIQGVAFMLNYSALTRAQVNAEGALLLLMKNASPWLHERLRETLKLLRRGRNLGQALDQNGYHFPSRHAIDRLILLTSGDHAEAIIENFAHNQLDKALKKITALASRLQLILYLLAGLYMGLVAYSTQNLSMMGS